MSFECITANAVSLNQSDLHHVHLVSPGGTALFLLVDGEAKPAASLTKTKMVLQKLKSTESKIKTICSLKPI